MGGASAVFAACVRNAFTHLEGLSALLVMVRAADWAAVRTLETETTYAAVDAGPSGRRRANHVTVVGEQTDEQMTPKRVSAWS